MEMWPWALSNVTLGTDALQSGRCMTSLLCKVHAHTDTHTHTHTHTHTNTHSHAHTQTDTYTHMHTRIDITQYTTHPELYESF
jgi:hypothetical protein